MRYLIAKNVIREVNIE